MEPRDLFAARSSADRLTSIDKVRAYMDIYMFTRDSDDLFLRGKRPALEPPARRIAYEHIALATNEADDYLKALGAAESITGRRPCDSRRCGECFNDRRPFFAQ